MFNLTRYFSLAALAAVVAVTVGIAVFSRNLAEKQLVAFGESSNVGLAGAFVSSMSAGFPRFISYVASTAGAAPEGLAARPETRVIDGRVRALSGALAVVKVKIYNLDGLTVYSSDPKQLGEDKGDNPGVVGARSGRVVSELTHRGSFDAFEIELFEVDVLSSYVAMRKSDGSIVGVIEVYADLTALMQRMNAVQLQLLFGFVAAFAALYLILFLIVRRADRVMASQHEKVRLEERVTALQAGHHDLEQEVSRRALAEAAARAAKDEAVLANRGKTEFLANMSHELRTPLNAIIGFSEIIANQMFGPAGSPRYVDYAQDILDSGTHLLQIVNDILDLSKVEVGQLVLQEEECDVAAIVVAALRLVQDRAKDGGLRLEQRLAPELPPVRADGRVLKQILINLLSNAVKFTAPGGTVTVGVALDDAGLSVSVADTGIGMAAADIPRALTAFGQIDSALNRKYDGTGLGLPLVKALTELHGGLLDLESEVGVGTTATVRLPRERLVGAGAAA
ncbi:MAG: HAMP domain-containing sensor histidine kinase [Dongiaceae bacterium]